MNLTKKVQSKSEPKAAEPVDMNMFEIDWNMEIPIGRNAGQTVKWIKQNDKGYWQWMIDNNMLENWFCYRVKGDKMTVKRTVTKYDKLRTTDATWYCLHEIEAPTTPAKEEWYKETQ